MALLEATFWKVGKPLEEAKHPRSSKGPTLGGWELPAEVGREEVCPVEDGCPGEAGWAECPPDEEGLTKDGPCPLG